MRLVCVLFSCALMWGCAGDDDGTGDGDTQPGDGNDVDWTDYQGEPSVALGTGESDFTLLNDGDEILVIQGAQGGHHFLGSVRVQGINPGNEDDLQDPTNPVTEFRVFRGEQRIDQRDAIYLQGLDPVAGEPASEMLGRLVILEIGDDTEINGLDLRFEVVVTGFDGVTSSDSHTLHVVPHPLNQ